MDTLSSTVDLEPTIWSVCLPNFCLILDQSAHFCWSSLLWAHVVFFPQTWSPTKTTIVWAIRSAQFREPTIAGGWISPFTSKEENAAAIVVNDVVQRSPEGSSSLGCRKWMKMNRTSLPNMEDLACCTHANWKDATSCSCSRFRHLFGIGSTWLYHQNWMVPDSTVDDFWAKHDLCVQILRLPSQQWDSGGWTYSGVETWRSLVSRLGVFHPQQLISFLRQSNRMTETPRSWWESHHKSSITAYQWVIFHCQLEDLAFLGCPRIRGSCPRLGIWKEDVRTMMAWGKYDFQQVLAAFKPGCQVRPVREASTLSRGLRVSILFGDRRMPRTNKLKKNRRLDWLVSTNPVY